MNEDARHHYQRAARLFEIERWSEALAEAQKCLAREPLAYRALCLVAASHYGLKDYDRALEFAGRAIAADPHEEWAYRVQSLCYQKKKKYKKALASAEECARAGPEKIHCLEILAGAQLESGRIKDARKTAETMRAIDPEAFATHETLGYVALNQFKIDEALAHFERALQINPESAQILSNYAWTLYARARRLSGGRQKRELLKNAIDVYELALRVKPADEATRDQLKRTIDLYILTDNVSIATLLSIVLIGGSLFFMKQLGYKLPDFLNISLKPTELFLVNALALIEIHVFGLVRGYDRAFRTLSPQSRFFLEREGSNVRSTPFLMLYAVLLALPLAVFGCRTYIYGAGSLLEISLFDWLSVAAAAAIFVYYLNYLRGRVKSSKLWNRLKLNTEKDF